MWVRVAVMVAGVIVLGIAVGCLRFAHLGVDTFSAWNLGWAKITGLGYATTQLLMNAVILVWMFFMRRSLIGIGTVVNMAAVGYISDFILWGLEKIIGDANMAVRVVLMVLALVLIAVGGASYIATDLGTAPYDSIAIILARPDRFPGFRPLRITTDIICVVGGVVIYLLLNGDIREVVGLATILAALVTGPLMHWFRHHLATPLLSRAAAAAQPTTRS
jgi:uncharacterized membrane protein YczE